MPKTEKTIGVRIDGTLKRVLTITLKDLKSDPDGHSHQLVVASLYGDHYTILVGGPRGTRVHHTDDAANPRVLMMGETVINGGPTEVYPTHQGRRDPSKTHINPPTRLFDPVSIKNLGVGGFPYTDFIKFPNKSKVDLEIDLGQVPHDASLVFECVTLPPNYPVRVAGIGNDGMVVPFGQKINGATLVVTIRDCTYHCPAPLIG